MKALASVASRHTNSGDWRQRDSLPDDTLKVADLVEDFLLRGEIRGLSRGTVQLYRYDLAHFVEFIKSHGVERLSEVGHQHIEGFLRVAQERGCSPHTVHGLYRNVRAFFRDLSRLYDGYRPPTEKVRPPKLPTLPPKALTIEQVQALIDSCGSIAHRGGRRGSTARRDAFFIRFVFDAGLRVSEALSVRLEDIDEGTGTILVKKGKGSQPRSLMIAQKTLLELRRHVRRLPTGSLFLFPSKDGQKPADAARLRRRLKPD